MISFENNVFHLATNNTSYIIGVFAGRLLNLYYGKRINSIPDIDSMLPGDKTRPFSCDDIRTSAYR